nr:hypothetical protein [Chryseobacterium fistulae]
MTSHKAAYPIVVTVIDGSIDFGVDSERLNLEKGMIIALEANMLHDLKATKDSIVLLSMNKSVTGKH